MPGIAAIQGIPGGIAAQAQQDQGHLFVAPAYYQVASDQAVQLDAAADWIASKIVPECDFELTDIAWYVTAVATQGDMALEIYSHDATNNQPNASLAVIVAASDCGASADVWIQEALVTAYQFYSGKTVWIVGKGTAGDDYSCSTRRWNTSQGSMFPDSMPETKVSTDSGSTWTAATQDSKPALWNIILNPNADGVPQLAYGRSSGKYAVTTAGLMETPEEAIFLDVSADTADTLYYVYLDTSGAISTSTTTWTKSNGMMVKSGDTSKKLVGMYYAIDVLGGGDQAPVNVMDRRLLAYPKQDVIFGKLCPYAGDTSVSLSADSNWHACGSSATDYKIEGVFFPGDIITLSYSVLIANTTGLAFGVDSTSEPSDYSDQNGITSVSGNLHNMIKMTISGLSGFHYFNPLAVRLSGTTAYLYYWTRDLGSGSYRLSVSSVLGFINGHRIIC